MTLAQERGMQQLPPSACDFLAAVRVTIRGPRVSVTTTSSLLVLQVRALQLGEFNNVSKIIHLEVAYQSK